MVDLWRLAGVLIGAPLGLLARWRRGKPMHPRGTVFSAVLERRGGGWGSPWLDQPARDDVVVRLSRGFGLPHDLPDLQGLAVRVPGPDAPVDLLLSSTGLGRFTRFLPLPRRDAACGYGSLMGYRSDAGTLRLVAIPERRAAGARPLRFTLAAAAGRRPFRPFARLTLAAPADPPDPDVRFDAVVHPPPGLVPDGPLARVRAPAYALARRGRSRAFS